MSRKYDDELNIDDYGDDFKTVRNPGKQKSRTRDESNDEKTYYIKEFDFNTMSPMSVDDKNGTKLVVIGKPGTGKSTLIADIIASKSHIIPVAQVFSGTEDSNHFYSEKLPSVCVFNKLDLNAVEQFIVRQKIAKKWLPNPWALQIIDDCTDDPKLLKRPIFQNYYKNGRHWKMLHILSLQYGLDIPPSIRNNIDYTFILREPSLNTREKIWKNYAGCIDHFSDFGAIMDEVTEDYTALVINNRVQSNKIEDCVFWYKAEPDRLPRNWKFGHPTAWEHHYARYDQSYQDPLVA